MMRIKINQILAALLVIYLWLVPFGQLWRLPTGVPGIAIHGADLVVGMLFLVWLAGFLIVKKTVKETTPLHKPIATFVMVALISLLWSAKQSPVAETLVGSLYLFRWVAYASIYLITLQLARVVIYRRLIYKALILSIGLLVVFGWLQYWFLPDLRFLYGQGWDDHYYRLTGTLLDPGFMGMMLVMGMIIIKLKMKNEKLKIRKSLFMIILYGALVLTYSRASYLALLAVVVVYSYLRKFWRFLLISGLIFLLTWIVLPRPQGEGGDLGRTSTINFRLVNWQQAGQVFIDHPILGVGFNRYRYIQRDYGFLPADKWQISHSGAGVDNSWLFVLATIGVAGLVAYGWLWWEMLRSSWRKGDLIFLTLVSLLVHSQFHNTLFYPPVMGWLWVMLGLIDDS